MPYPRGGIIAARSPHARHPTVHGVQHQRRERRQVVYKKLPYDPVKEFAPCW